MDQKLILPKHNNTSNFLSDVKSSILTTSSALSLAGSMPYNLSCKCGLNRLYPQPISRTVSWSFIESSIFHPE